MLKMEDKTTEENEQQQQRSTTRKPEKEFIQTKKVASMQQRLGTSSEFIISL